MPGGKLLTVVDYTGKLYVLNVATGRFVDEIPSELIEEVPSSSVSAPPMSFSHFRANPYGRGYRGNRVREETDYAYADEDQSIPSGLRPGVRVRHPQFGVGTVLSVEQLDDDIKLLVRFNTVGQKTLRAKFARLEPA